MRYRNAEGDWPNSEDAEQAFAGIGWTSSSDDYPEWLKYTVA